MTLLNGSHLYLRLPALNSCKYFCMERESHESYSKTDRFMFGSYGGSYGS